MIEYMLGTGEVWFARLEDIAGHVQSLRRHGRYDARIDKLPYYDRPADSRSAARHHARKDRS